MVYDFNDQNSNKLTDYSQLFPFMEFMQSEPKSLLIDPIMQKPIKPLVPYPHLQRGTFLFVDALDGGSPHQGK